MEGGGQLVSVLVGGGLGGVLYLAASVLEGALAGVLDDVLGGVPPLVLMVFWTRLDLSLIHHVERPA